MFIGMCIMLSLIYDHLGLYLIFDLYVLYTFRCIDNHVIHLRHCSGSGYYGNLISRVNSSNAVIPARHQVGGATQSFIIEYKMSVLIHSAIVKQITLSLA